MLAPWSALVPLVLVSAVLPLQTLVALALVRESLASARAWVAGMVTVRLLQGIVFGVLVEPSEGRSDGPRYFLGALLLVLALALYTKAFRAAAGVADEDAPPPDWIAKAKAMSPLAAFAAGAGFMTISVKFLVFTLAAISAIAEAELSMLGSVFTFALFVGLGQIAPILILGLAASSSNRATAALDGLSLWLKRNDRVINIAFGVIFGTWFLLKAAARLGVM